MKKILSLLVFFVVFFAFNLVSAIGISGDIIDIDHCSNTSDRNALPIIVLSINGKEIEKAEVFIDKTTKVVLLDVSKSYDIDRCDSIKEYNWKSDFIEFKDPENSKQEMDLSNIKQETKIPITISITDGNGGVTSKNIILIKEPSDNIPPVIEIIGDNPVSIYRGDSYEDTGAIAKDDVDGDVTSNIKVTDNIDINTVGSYIVSYSVSDKAGNISNKTRVVNVIPKIVINTAPFLILYVDDKKFVDSEIRVDEGTKVVSLDASKSYDIDKDDSVKKYEWKSDVIKFNDSTDPIQKIELSGIESDKRVLINLSIMDGNGGVTSKDIAIVIKKMDDIIMGVPILLELSSSSSTSRPVKSVIWQWSSNCLDAKYRVVVDTNPTYTFTNEEYSGIRSHTQLSGDGVYYIHLQAKSLLCGSESGIKTVSATLDNTSPIITMPGASELTMYKGDSYSDNDVSVTDNIDTNITLSKSLIVDSNNTGIYNVIYSAIDSAGNRAISKRRIVNILDRPSSGGGSGSTLSVSPINSTITPQVLGEKITSANERWVKIVGNSSVYFVDTNNVRHIYPTQDIWSSYFGKDFSFVSTITKEELATYPLGKNVAYKSGTLIKIVSIPKVYLVGENSVIQWITSEEVAIRLYGKDWNKLVHDLPDAFFGDYTLGTDIN